MPEAKHPLKVFLCHASQDKPVVRELSRRLVGEGWIDTWQDEKNLLPGQDWRVKIEEAVEDADVVIICLSNHSVSKEGHVQKELRYAREIALEKPEDAIFLIPLRLDECEVPRGLRFYQWVDYFGEKKDSSYIALVTSLRLRYEQKLKAEKEERLRREEQEREAAEKVRLKAKEEERKRIAREKVEREDAERKQEEPNKGKRTDSGDKEIKQKIERYKKNIQPILWVGVPIILAIGFYAFLNRSLPLPEATPPVTATVTLTKEPSETPKPTAIPPTSTLSPTPLPPEITDAKGVPMVLVPAGEFTMGRSAAENKEMPAHKVYLDAFYMDIYEITNARYIAFLNAGARPTIGIRSGYPDFPVNTTWFESETYCKWRGARLPTEAEWEKAARGTDDRTYPWGESIDCSYANYWKCKGDTTKVGSYEKGKSPYGIYDMAGNLAEWVADWFSDTYYNNSPFTNPLGPQTGEQKVRRGGSWYFSEDSLRVSSRFGNDPNIGVDAFGFRCARSVP
jgi:formylglycine-generating enzyme required for sulfatase activity